MEEYTLTVIKGKTTEKISASPRDSILANLRDADYTEPDAPCGGAGTCLKCIVIVTGRIRNMDTGTISDVTEQKLLACCYAPAGELSVMVGDSGRMTVQTTGTRDLTPGGEGLGFAVDIGTTTVAAFLYDLKTGKQLAALGERNAQRAYGADVISRISACSEGKQESLCHSIRTQLADMARSLCGQQGVSLREIRKISIAGNTVMEHLFADLDPVSIGVAPFTPVSLFGDTKRASELLPELLPEPELDVPLYLCPCVAGYVGGDITAGLMASDSDQLEGLRLYIDIGTNGEMGLGNHDGYICCATAAGPAFEGAEIACGMSGSPGAIDKVSVVDGDIVCHVIGETDAKGICGSGLIDAIAAMLQLGVINAGGRLLDAEDVDSSKAACRIAKGSDGQNIFLLQDGVFIAARDIRELQLAKAAIRAGAETLLQLQGKTAADLTDLVLAGGFGSYMSKYSALRIGLLPEVDPEIIRHVGNAAGAGASQALTPEGEMRLAAMGRNCSYLELSSSAEFMDNYVEFMAFDEEE